MDFWRKFVEYFFLWETLLFIERWNWLNPLDGKGCENYLESVKKEITLKDRGESISIGFTYRVLWIQLMKFTFQCEIPRVVLGRKQYIFFASGFNQFWCFLYQKSDKYWSKLSLKSLFNCWIVRNPPKQKYCIVSHSDSFFVWCQRITILHWLHSLLRPNASQIGIRLEPNPNDIIQRF